MANQQYDQLESLIADGMNWESVTVYSFLFSGATFDPTEKRVSQVGQWIKREPLQGKFIDGGDLCGQPAVFYMVAPDTEYQVILAYDDGRSDPLLLGFFDEGYDAAPITVERPGSLFVRPYTPNGEEAPSYSIWLQPEQA
jgi:hypothetical protein